MAMTIVFGSIKSKMKDYMQMQFNQQKNGDKEKKHTFRISWFTRWPAIAVACSLHT